MFEIVYTLSGNPMGEASEFVCVYHFSYLKRPIETDSTLHYTQSFYTISRVLSIVSFIFIAKIGIPHNLKVKLLGISLNNDFFTDIFLAL